MTETASGAACICGPLASSDGEDIDIRPDCPAHADEAAAWRELRETAPDVGEDAF